MNATYADNLLDLTQMKASGSISAEEYHNLGMQLFNAWETNLDNLKKRSEKNHELAGYLAILLGLVGGHKFYLGYYKEGLSIFLVNILNAAFFNNSIFQPLIIIAMAVFVFIEAIIYWRTDQYNFVLKYIWNKKPWF